MSTIMYSDQNDALKANSPISPQAFLSSFNPHSIKQIHEGHPYREYYTGIFGNEKVQMDALVDSKGIYVETYHENDGIPISFLGSYNQNGTATLTYSNGLSVKTSAHSLREMFKSNESNSKFEGTFKMEGNLINYKITKVAEYINWSTSYKDINAQISYPFFISDNPGVQNVNKILRKQIVPLCTHILMHNKKILDLFGPKAESNQEYSIRYYSDADDLISIKVEHYDSFANSDESIFYNGLNYKILNDGKVIPLELKDLFLDGAEYAKVITDFAIKSLGRQGFIGVSSEEIQSLNETDLRIFTFTSKHIELVFPKNRVGNGDILVSLIMPFEELMEVINPEGILKKFI